AGLMEIADIFVVNKADHDYADQFVRHLKELVHEKTANEQWSIPVLKTVATKNEGIHEVEEAIQNHLASYVLAEKKVLLMASKAYQYLRDHRMKDIDKEKLKQEIEKNWHDPDFNIYSFMQKHYFTNTEITD
ncbi:MAG: methylmalonyl Co-A mutase-associated GTPase MeaB, partial [Bacteroidetes bacterium SW_11_45_7]